MSGHSARQRSGALLMVRPPSQLALKRPSLKRLGPNRRGARRGVHCRSGRSVRVYRSQHRSPLGRQVAVGSLPRHDHGRRPCAAGFLSTTWWHARWTAADHLFDLCRIALCLGSDHRRGDATNTCWRGLRLDHNGRVAVAADDQCRRLFRWDASSKPFQARPLERAAVSRQTGCDPLALHPDPTDHGSAGFGQPQSYPASRPILSPPRPASTGRRDVGISDASGSGLGGMGEASAPGVGLRRPSGPRAKRHCAAIVTRSTVSASCRASCATSATSIPRPNCSGSSCGVFRPFGAGGFDRAA